MNRSRIRLLAIAISVAVMGLVAASLALAAEWGVSPARRPAGPGAWTQLVIPGLSDDTRVYAIRRAGELILLGTQGQGLFRSVDSGGAWQQVPQFTDAHVRDLWLGGTNGHTALAATYGAGLLRSVDGGVSWRPVGANIGTNLLYSLASAGGVLYLGTANAGVWRSVDNGVSWSATGIIGSPGAVAVTATSAQVAYAGSVNNGLYRTDDGGATWQQLAFAGKTVRSLALDPADSQVVWASVLGEGVYSSTDGGQSWTMANSGLAGSNVLALLVTDAADNSQALAGAQGGGVLRWTGSDWALWGLPGRDVFSLARWNDTLYAGAKGQAWDYSFPPTPTPTATPTAGLSMLLLGNDPANAIQPGEEILYTIHYRNGPRPLTRVAISNTIPLHVVLAPNSISSGGSSSGSGPGDVVSWDIGDLAADAAGSVFYRVQRPTVMPTITSTVTPTLTPILLTGALGPRLMGINATTPTPAPSQAGASASVQASLATTASDSGAPEQGAGVTGVRPDAHGSNAAIVNAGATAGWRFDGQPGQMTSNLVVNPSVLRYLPLIYHNGALH